MTSILHSRFSSYHGCRDGMKVEIIRQLTPDDDGYEGEFEPKYLVRFYDKVETVAYRDELPGLLEYRLCEVVHDITTCIPLVVGVGAPHEGKEYDSRDLFACIYKWAKEFEGSYPYIGDEYLSTVEEFACEKLSEYFAD